MLKKLTTRHPATALYSFTVLLTAWLATAILFIEPSTGVKYFSLIMFIPAIIAVGFRKFLYQEMIAGRNKGNLKALSFGIGYPIAFVLLCGAVAQVLGIGTFKSGELPDTGGIIRIVVTIIVNLFAVLGEEYGWRGYLLPKLTVQLGKIKATLIVGVVWALYHVPAVFLLAKATGMSHPLLLCAVQACVVYTVNFAFSYCYYLSGSLVPVLFFHSVWNVVNTTVLGDIYTNKQGIVGGRLILINGEGLLGLVIGGLIIFWFVSRLRRNN
jgi:membrane protease YdiL (CAAX protease family)